MAEGNYCMTQSTRTRRRNESTTTNEEAPTRRRRTRAAQEPNEPVTEVAPLRSKTAAARSESRWWQTVGGDDLRATSITTGTHRARWTEEDDALVMSDQPLPEIARQLNRTYHAVASRRHILVLAAQEQQ
jgi:hypothetical protein